MRIETQRVALSEAGAERKARILAAAQECLDRRQTQRRAGAMVMTAGAAAVAIGVGVWVARAPSVSAPAVPVAANGNQATEPPPAPAAAPALHNIRFETVASGTPLHYLHVMTIDDESLIDALAESGAPSGILRSGGRTVVVSNTVAAEPSHQ